MQCQDFCSSSSGTKLSYYNNKILQHHKPYLIDKHRICRADFLERLLRSRILVPVRMELQRQLPVCRLDILLGGRHDDAQGRVVGVRRRPLHLSVHLLFGGLIVGLYEVVVVAKLAVVGASTGVAGESATTAAATARTATPPATRTAWAPWLLVLGAAASSAMRATGGTSSEAVERVAAAAAGVTARTFLVVVLLNKVTKTCYAYGQTTNKKKQKSTSYCTLNFSNLE